MTSLLTTLRERTADAHRQLEVAHARNGDVTRDSYVALLRGSLAAVAAIEPTVARWLPASARPSRSACLRHDLAALRECGEVEPVALPLADDEATAWGAAYVMEGSTLGGMVLAQQFETVLARDERGATSYLRLRGGETGTHWRTFVRALEGARLEPTAVEQSVRAAEVCFGAYRTAFLQHHVIAA